jgi:Ca2+:H+ antiporter
MAGSRRSWIVANWAAIVSPVSALILGAAFALPPGTFLTLVCAAALVAGVLAAVHHAEVVAHKVGEPLGALVLALAVTTIEAALIVTMMMAGGAQAAALARDSLYAAVMIICTGVVGLCLFVGALRHHEQTFKTEGSGPAFAALLTLSIIVLVLPDFTTSAPAPHYSPSQLTFTALASLALWAAFVFFQTIRHRDYFVADAASNEDAHAEPPSAAAAWTAFALLAVSLVAVVGLAKKLSPAIEAGVAAIGAPQAAIGVAIAMLVLLPETVAAVRAAYDNRLQTSMNLALGSALACIGLTVPVVVAASFMLGLPLALGLDPKDIVLLALAFLVGTITLATGRTNLMQGAVHLVLFAAFLFLTLVP